MLVQLLRVYIRSDLGREGAVPNLLATATSGWAAGRVRRVWSNMRGREHAAYGGKK